ncbi:DNA cytosine methyltransferase [Cohnella soli]|uniref:Cytosine-specific methyltransferase n=1 Tax=Cohnella soli TaxID=425005 RepID=A0ABW0HQ26_9BACL
MFERSDKLTVCSFFAGGGLLDYGFKDDFDIVWANELNPAAAACYRANIGDHIQICDLAKVKPSDIPFSDGFIGGPPCIDYSSTGANRGEFGSTGKLVWVYFELINAKRPKFFIFENVLGLAVRHKETLERLLRAFEQSGYNVSVEILDASTFGVSQARKRVFIAGIRRELGFTFRFPVPTHTKSSVRDAIGDLPAPTTIAARDRMLGTFPNHVATWESPTPERIVDVIHHPRSQWRGMRRLVWEEQSPTLTAHIAKDGREHLHPEEPRRITVREGLRLMSVPDDFVIPTEVPLSHQYRIVGNGIAYNIAKALSEEMNAQIRSHRCQLQFERKGGRAMIWFHGTSQSNRNAIWDSWFVPNEGTWGKGVYFSSSLEGSSFFGDCVLRVEVPDVHILNIDFEDWQTKYPEEDSWADTLLRFAPQAAAIHYPYGEVELCVFQPEIIRLVQ